MPKQMQLWAAPHQLPQVLKIWENLENQLQQNVITALANLMCEMVLSQDVSHSQEESRER